MNGYRIRPRIIDLSKVGASTNTPLTVKAWRVHIQLQAGATVQIDGVLFDQSQLPYSVTLGPGLFDPQGRPVLVEHQFLVQGTSTASQSVGYITLEELIPLP